MKYLKTYEHLYETNDIDKIQYDFDRSPGWKKSKDLTEFGTDTIDAYEYKLNKYKLVVLFRKFDEKKNVCILYFYDGEHLGYLENLVSPIRSSYRSNIAEWCVRLGEEQLDYYREKDKLPTEEQLKDIFQELSDIDLTLGEISYGYPSKDFLKDVWDTEIHWSKYGSGSNSVVCLMKFVSDTQLKFTPGTKSKTYEIQKEFEFCKERLLSEYNVLCNIHMWPNEKYVMITIKRVYGL